jgi:hypothetical protein
VRAHGRQASQVIHTTFAIGGQVQDLLQELVDSHQNNDVLSAKANYRNSGFSLIFGDHIETIMQIQEATGRFLKAFIGRLEEISTVEPGTPVDVSNELSPSMQTG